MSSGYLYREPLSHYRAGGGVCLAADGFDVDLLGQTTTYDDQDREVEHLRGLRLICRACGHYDTHAELVPAQVFDDGSEHRSGTIASKLFPPVKAGPLQLLPEDTLGWSRTVWTYTAATRDGDVVGLVQSYLTRRHAERWRCGVLDGVEPPQEGFTSPAAAGRALAHMAGLS
jgi:hypothetical protein